MKISQAIKNSKISKSEARSLLSFVTGLDIPYLIANDETQLCDKDYVDFVNISQRRELGHPMGYLMGKKEFYGSVFTISRDVLIPRPETELLVEVALANLPLKEPSRLLELGTGCGVIAISLLLNHRKIVVDAIDISEEALKLARQNADDLLSDLTRIDFFRSNWLADVSNEVKYNMVVANPPYVGDRDVHLTKGDVRFEPSIALVGGSDGLFHIRQIVSNVLGYLSEGGWLIVEHGYNQAGAVQDIFQVNGYSNITQIKDLAGNLRVTLGQLEKAIDYK